MDNQLWVIHVTRTSGKFEAADPKSCTTVVVCLLPINLQRSGQV